LRQDNKPKELKRLAKPRLAIKASMKGKKAVKTINLEGLLNFTWEIAIAK
jgi:hypothetical protein